MDPKVRMTKQGIRDLNFYGSRKKPLDPNGSEVAQTGDGRPVPKGPETQPEKPR